MRRKHWTRRNQRKLQRLRQRLSKRLKPAASPVKSASVSYPPYADFSASKPKQSTGFVKSKPGPLPKEPKNEPGDFMDWDFT